MKIKKLVSSTLVMGLLMTSLAIGAYAATDESEFTSWETAVMDKSEDTEDVEGEEATEDVEAFNAIETKSMTIDIAYDTKCYDPTFGAAYAVSRSSCKQELDEIEAICTIYDKDKTELDRKSDFKRNRTSASVDLENPSLFQGGDEAKGTHKFYNDGFKTLTKYSNDTW